MYVVLTWYKVACSFVLVRLSLNNQDRGALVDAAVSCRRRAGLNGVMVIEYDPDRYATGFGFLRIITAFHGTVLPHVLRSGLFWTVIILHSALQLIEFSMHYNFHGNASVSVGASSDGNARPTFGEVVYTWEGLTASAPGHDGLPRVSWEVGTVSFTLCIFFLVFSTSFK